MAERDTDAIILDFLPQGYPMDKRPSHKKTPIAQAIGTKGFSLLELVPRDGEFLDIGQQVYIGEGKREKIHHVEGRIPVSKLTNTATSELQYVIEQLVEANEKRFVDFFNNARPLSTRMHSLELLPGVGKKHMWEVLDAREDKPFESFKDLDTRVKLLPKPMKIIIRRIMNELEEDQKHYIFVDKPAQKRER